MNHPILHLPRSFLMFLESAHRSSCLIAILLAMISGSSAYAADSATAPQELLYWTTSQNLSSSQRAELSKIAPNVRFVDFSRSEALARATEIHGADARLVSEKFLAAAKNLRWVQAQSAGVDRYLGLKNLMENDRIIFTNMKTAHGPVISEHVFAMLLHLRRDLGVYLDAQRKGVWSRGASAQPVALSGTTLVVAGMGGIGREIAKRGKGFDMEVLATVRTAREAPAYVDELGTADDLDGFLARADVVVISLPLTDETLGLFDADRIARIKPEAIIINIGRGPIVDTDALVAALQSGHLAGAGLDVTNPEPLPRNSPLWAMDNVVITPHVASRAQLTGDRRAEIFRKNVELFAQGQELINVVDKEAGY